MIQCDNIKDSKLCENEAAYWCNKCDQNMCASCGVKNGCVTGD